MITEIGIIAGDIWHVLDEKSPVVLKILLQEIDAPRDLILMSLGWLSREGHVSVTSDYQNDFLISLV